MKFLMALIFFVFSSVSQAADNVIAMSYATMTVYQQIVLSTAQKAGGTFTLSVQAKDGGGRGPPNYPSDIANLSIQYYNSSGTLLATSTSNNSTTYGETTFRTYTLTSANCGGAGCANVHFIRVNLTGNDGGFWAGNVGTNFRSPELTFTPDGGTASTNILYNPEFGVNGVYTTTSGPHGWWNSTNAWGGNTRPQLLDYGATVNSDAGGFSANGGTLSGQVGGYPTTAPAYTANISTAQQSRVTAFQNRTVVNNTIYIDQVGDNNIVNITQSGRANEIRGIGQQAAVIQGSGNNVTIRQGDLDTTGKNSLELRVIGSTNTLNLNQSVTTTGASVGSSNNHYQSVDIAGSSNSVTTQQTNTGGAGGHYMETTITGNTNTLNATQINNGNKTMFNTITGSNNTVSVVQKDAGQHYLESTLTGSGNTLTAVQEGATANRASITINNSGGPGAVDLIQSGGAVYNITTTCVTAGGCGTVTVRQ